MRWPVHSATLCSLVIIVGACAPAVEQPGSALEAPDTTEADIEAVTELVQKLHEQWTAGDVDAAMANFADGAVEMPSNEPVVIGKEAIRLRTAQHLSTTGPWRSNYDAEYTSTVEDVQVSGDLAFVQTSNKEIWTPKVDGDSPPIVVTKRVFVFRRQVDRSWKIAIMIWNLDAFPGSRR